MAKQLTTDQAFEQLLESPYYWSLTGLPKATRRYYRSVIRTGRKPVSTAKKEEMLALAGFSIRQEKAWGAPK